MDYVVQTGCPDILLSPNGADEWILCPVSQKAKTWVEETLPLEEERNIAIRGFAYVVELFDSLTDRGLTVR